MFGWWPRKPVDFYFPTMRGAQWHKHVNEYIAHLWDHLREICKETQDQSMVEEQWQKWCCDKWINTISLEPGDLVLVKVYLYWGKRDIKDWWEDMLHNVGHQVMKDSPLYIVEDEQGPSQILHCNNLLHITPEVERGIQPYADVCTTWARCTSLTLDELTPEESETEELWQWADWLVPTRIRQVRLL